jgi:hypothetical protein
VPGEDDLHVVLVHAGGGGEDARADVAHVGEVEEALERPVLTERTVQQREDDVDGAELPRRLTCLEHGERGLPRRQRQDDVRVARLDLGRAARRQLEAGRVVGGEHPLAVASDADGHDLVLAAVDGSQHPRCGGAGDGMLGGTSSEDDGDARAAARLVGLGLVRGHQTRLYPERAGPLVR